ncbi:hypothetical protein C9374_012232 [Naegleria lovaniensis]|uniref:Uncharacterized protein n=1 Tax=Naegleria lovaniensis TaxID=51637 RepID=A0AA88GG15_NAELO|nr:uncharacterized protein C9374_012232 [Naegleria lovaniensis]KAG2373366.1 hypothetical protein C9374_012232 [Naegleria lovaniensis]
MNLLKSSTCRKATLSIRSQLLLLSKQRNLLLVALSLLLVFFLHSPFSIHARVSSTSSALRFESHHHELHELLRKTRGWLKHPLDHTTTATPNDHYYLQVDFKVHSRSPHISFQKNHKAIPLYKGRAIVSMTSPSSSTSERIRLVSVSSLLSEALYFDSHMNSYARVRWVATNETAMQPSNELVHEKPQQQRQPHISTLPSPVDFNSLLKTILDSNHYIPEHVPIYDEAADRLCPMQYFDRHVVFFEHSHYLLCMKKGSTSASAPPSSTVGSHLSTINAMRAMDNSLMNLRYIIGQEFTVDISAMSLHRGEVNDEKTTVKTRGQSNNIDIKISPTRENLMSLFSESPLIQEELKEIMTKQQRRSSQSIKISLINKSHIRSELTSGPPLEDLFPKKPVQLIEKSTSEKRLLQSEQYTSPAKSYFFHLDSIACLLPWLKDSKKCSQQHNMRELHERRICVFLHGAGQWPTDKGEPIDYDFENYWGPVSHYTPQCSERWFIREETKYRGWDNKELQQSYCDILLMKQKLKQGDMTWSSNKVVKNVIIYAHSMGNLILAAAIKNGVCSLDKTTVSWYDLMGPLRGSPAANMLDTVCAQDDWNVKRILASKGGYCMSDSMKMYPTYETLHTNYSGLSELQKIAKEYVTGQLCGTSSYGLNSMYSAPLELLSKLVNYGELNDGLVPYSSCAVDKEAPFSESYEDTFYKTAANHVDGTCKSGDSWFGSTKPCSFFINKT